MTETSPIFSKTFLLMIWLMQHTEKFPKSERFRLAKRLNDSLFDFQQSLIEAAYGNAKLDSLTKADIDLAKLRIYGRLSREMKFSSIKQYEYFSSQLVEIGRLLGGWKKSINAAAS